jgi:serine/threonine-protein kinase HipA
VNPSIDKATHVLNIDDVDNRPSLETVLATAAFYRLTPKRAKDVVGEVIAVVADWKAVARRAKIAAADIELSASAFAALVD